MMYRVVTCLLFLCVSALLVCGSVPQAQGYILTPPEFRLYLGNRFPVAWAFNSGSGFSKYRPITIHADQGHFFMSTTAEETAGSGSTTFILDKLDASVVQFWLTADDVEFARVSVPVVRPTFASASLLENTDTARYALSDQNGHPISGAPVLMRLNMAGRIIYASAGQTDAQGFATFTIPYNRFAGKGNAEFYSYRMACQTMEVIGKAAQTILPTADDPIGIYAVPEKINNLWCNEFPILVTAINHANAPMPDVAFANTNRGGIKFRFNAGIGMEVLPLSFYSYDTISLSLYMSAGASSELISAEKKLDVIMYNPGSVKVDSHFDLQPGKPSRLLVTISNNKDQPLADLPVAANFFNLPYQVYRTDSNGSFSVMIPSLKTHSTIFEKKRFTDFHLDFYDYHDFMDIGIDNKWRVTSLYYQRIDKPAVVLESVAYDKKGHPTVTRP